MATKQIGSGRIRVSLKRMHGVDGGYVDLLCDGIEIYGEDRMAFSDADGDLVRIDGKIVEARIENVFRIRHI